MYPGGLNDTVATGHMAIHAYISVSSSRSLLPLVRADSAKRGEAAICEPHNLTNKIHTALAVRDGHMQTIMIRRGWSEETRHLLLTKYDPKKAATNACEFSVTSL